MNIAFTTTRGNLLGLFDALRVQGFNFQTPEQSILGIEEYLLTEADITDSELKSFGERIYRPLKESNKIINLYSIGYSYDRNHDLVRSVAIFAGLIGLISFHRYAPEIISCHWITQDFENDAYNKDIFTKFVENLEFLPMDDDFDDF